MGCLPAPGVELGTWDYFLLSYYILFSIAAGLLVIAPFGKFHEWCTDAHYDAVSEQTYTEILNARGIDANNKVTGDDRPLSLMVLRQDLHEKRIWHNDWKKDFATFVRQDHGLFSLFYAHPSHPFARRDRKAILIATLLLDFSVGVGLTIFFTTAGLGGFTEFIFDFGLSFILGYLMTALETMLINFAICTKAEKCPNCCRKAIKAAGSATIFVAFVGSVSAVMFAIVSMLGFGGRPWGLGYIWPFYIFQFFMGLFQGWFFMDIAQMGIDFYKEWKGAHPPPRPDDWTPPEKEIVSEEERNKRRKRELAICITLNCITCCCYSTCGCRKDPSEEDEIDDPYDDGQGDFGVNYYEYSSWKNGEEIGDRELPMEYQKDFGELAEEMKAKMDATKEKTKAAGKAAYKSTKNFGNKLKAKAMKMHADMNQVKTDDEGDDSAYDESVELVVDSNEQNENVEDKIVDKVENNNEVSPDNEQEQGQDDEVPDWLQNDGGNNEPEVEDTEKVELVTDK